MATLQQITGREVVTKVVSRVKRPENRLGQWFGFTLTGAGNSIPNRYFGYDVFNHTRTIAKGRAPMTPAARVSPQVVGHVSGVFPRSYEVLPLYYERIFNGRPLGGPYSEVDPMGERYVTAQTEHLAQRFNNWVEILTAGMVRDSLYFKHSGDDVIPRLTDTGNNDTTRIDFKVPTQNFNQIARGTNGANLITTSWDQIGAGIIIHLLNISAAMEQAHGRPLRDIWVTSTTWGNVLRNTQVQTLAGTSVSPFDTFTRVDARGPDGIQVSEQYARLRGLPWLDWHIIDSGLDVDGVFTKVIGDNNALMLPAVDSDWVEMGYGSEPVAERDGEVPQPRTGFHAWRNYKANPAQVELYAIFNGLPFLYIPACLMYATVTF